MPLVPNHAKRRLAAGGLALGFGVNHLRTPAAGMIAAACGYDWLFIDMEHGAMSVDDATRMCIAALGQGVTPIVRCCKDALHEGTRALDNGAGDVWILGPHRLICGNALEAACYERLLGDERAQMVFTDPPYNVPIDGHVCGLGQVRHRSFAMAAGEMSRQQFIEFLAQGMKLMARFSLDGSIHYVFMDWRHMFEVLVAGEGVYSETKNVCVWNKTNGGMGSLYRSKHELVTVFKKCKAPHINNVELGQHGRYRTNVWDYAGVNTLK